MTRTNPPRTADQRIFSSPVALAFVRTVAERRKISEAQARKVYLNYINRLEPADPTPVARSRDHVK
jgi:hypothetical protein